MTARDWLTILIGYEGAPAGLDPVRLQKGLFLFAQEASGVAAEEKYEFKPYNYGPMSTQIYRDLDQLEADGLVERVPVEGQRWSRYRATASGVATVRRLLTEMDDSGSNAARLLFSIKRQVAGVGFRELLEDVYQRYPAYAEESVFRTQT
jgi:DNA-binding PadR family transcriptional regulator